ncbi:FAD-dependent oxidoreductase [Nonomuraea purpurea]|uniref:FAD-dependent oxidoreductase n=1 Tax=Nonomuraea purpurea TaxID=1849276 RepID=A0ABV8G675_9ACTN
MSRTALVIGGGIAGPATAMALQQAGIEPTIYEAYPEGADGAGVFLTLGSNGIDALAAIGADGRATADGFATPEITLRGAKGKRLGISKISAANGAPSRTVRRADLYRALYEEAAGRGIPIHHGRRLVSAEQSGTDVRATFADGTTATGDLLIGCDGVHSTVRGAVDPLAPAAAYAGLISLGGYTRGVRVDEEPGSYTMIFGRRAFFGYAVAPDREVWWFVNLPRAAEPDRGELAPITGEQWLRTLVDAFKDDAGPAVRILEATPVEQVMKASPVHLLKRLPTWHRGRMIVLGDAAHAPSPSSGQGASLAVEDAVILGRCLRDTRSHTAAFDRFVELRRPRVEKIVKQAARINNSKAAGPVGRLFLDSFMPLILRAAANSAYTEEVYGHRLTDEPAAAR